MTGNDCFYVKIADGVATYLRVSEDETKTIVDWEQIATTTSTDLIQVTAGSADDPATSETDETSNTVFSIGNTPGAEIPSTGGRGTTLYYLFGIALIALTGTGFAMKRRWREA